jgi:hypothetical protein
MQKVDDIDTSLNPSDVNYISIAIQTLFELEVLFNPANQFGSISSLLRIFLRSKFR